MIKVCGIRDPLAALAAADAGATAVGIVFSRSPRMVSLRQAARTFASVPPGVERIAVLRAADLQRVPAILHAVAIDALQIHGGRLPANLHGLEVISAGSLKHVLEQPHRRVLADSPSGAGSGAAWDYATAAARGYGPRLVLAGGLTARNVRAAIHAARPYGVDVSSGVERRPGIKDHGLMREFVCRARQALADVAEARQ